METVLIACKESQELDKIEKAIKKHFNIHLIHTPSMLKKVHNQFDLMLLDHQFTQNSGIDFLMDINIHKSVPVLFLTPDNDPQCAVEALRAGAFNYIVKTGNYISILNIAVRDALNKFNELTNLKEKIEELQRKLQELHDKNKSDSSRVNLYTKQTQVKQFVKKEKTMMEEIISRLKKGEINLPSLPHINIKFKKLVIKGANIDELAQLLKQDVAIATTLINISNTAFYRGIEESKNLESAMTRLGLGTTKKYVEVISNRSLYTSKNKKYSAVLEKLWIHSLSCAYASGLIAKELNIKTKNDPFTLGLIHDIGKLVLIQIIGELEAKGKIKKETSADKLEQTMYEYHGKFGAVLLKKWGFPEEFIQVAMYHDSINEVKNPSADFMVVHFSNLLVKSMGFSMDDNLIDNIEASQSCKFLNLQKQEIEDLKINITNYMKEFKKVL